MFDYVSVTGSFNEKLARSVFMQLLDGLCAMHAKKIAHRDIKLENLMFDIDFNVKVIDLGFATFYEKYDMESLLGTKTYMAPEMVKQKGNYTPKIDVFSSGVVLFTLVCGFPPWAVVSDKDWYCKRWEQKKYDFLWEYYNGKVEKAGGAPLSPEFMDLINKMLEWDPKDRLSAEEVRNHAWMQMDLFEAEILFDKLKEKKAQLEQLRKGVPKRGAQDIQDWFDKNAENQLTMERVTKNKFRERLSKVESEKDLEDIFKEMGEGNRLQDLYKAERIGCEDVSTFGKKMAEIHDTPEDAPGKALQTMFKDPELCRHIMDVLNKNTEPHGEVFDFSQKLFDFAKKYKHIDETSKAPVLWKVRQELYSFEVRCSPAVVLYTLIDFVTNKYQKENLKIIPLEDGLPNLCELILETEVNYPTEENKDAVKTVQTKIEVQCYQRKNVLVLKENIGREGMKLNCVSFVRASKHLDSLKEFSGLIQNILSETILDKCIV